MPEQTESEVTSAPELDSTSEAEQMYLITVAREAESGHEGPVPVAHVADMLGVSVPSANEMIRKLDGRGLLTYEPYRGVQLTGGGRRIADQVLRTRRLWATFLAEHLDFTPQVADEQACQLEHATSREAADRLATFLGNPEAGPLGRPIPSAHQADRPRAHVRLSDLPVGISAEVVSVVAGERPTRFLVAEGIVPGARLSLTAAGGTGVLIEIGDDSVHLDRGLADMIGVHPDHGGGR